MANRKEKKGGGSGCSKVKTTKGRKKEKGDEKCPTPGSHVWSSGFDDSTLGSG